MTLLVNKVTHMVTHMVTQWCLAQHHKLKPQNSRAEVRQKKGLSRGHRGTGEDKERSLTGHWGTGEDKEKSLTGAQRHRGRQRKVSHGGTGAQGKENQSFSENSRQNVISMQ